MQHDKQAAGEHRDGHSDEIKNRKLEHVAVTLRQDISGRLRASWADVELIHQSLPEVNLDDIDLSTSFLGHKLTYPIFISSLTGGHPDVIEINRVLARVAGEFGLAMGVGSQRAAIKDHSLIPTYEIVRKTAPDAFLIGNIGAPQLIAQPRHEPFTFAQITEAIAMIRADALAVHLNYLQEATQPEGDRRAVGCVAALSDLTRRLDLPVIAKETGAGICREQALLLKSCGVAAIDIGGAGGSSMAAIEMHRSLDRQDQDTASLGRLYRNWGLATPVALVEAASAGLPLISTGGMRTGLDAAKALALGATLVGMGSPFLQAAAGGYEAVVRFLTHFLAELRVAMFLSGAGSLAELRHCDVVIGGESGRWLQLRGFDLASFAQRRLRLL